MCNIVDGGTEYAFLEKYIFYSNLNRHYAIMKHMDARDKEKEDSDEKNIVYHKRYSHYRRDSAGVFYGLFVDTKQYCGKCADPGSIYFWSLSDFCDHTGYLYGVAAAILSVLEVNFAFTFPFFHFNFSIPENMASAVIIILMALITCGFTTKIKYNKILEAEREKEKIRADIFRAVSHDLRTPLTTIYGSSSALLDPDNDFTKEQRTKMLQDIQQDAQWLFRMVENLLSITKLDSGKVKIIKTPTVLDELIDSVILKFHKRYPDQEVEIDIPDEFVVIPMDAILIQQVLINILENAVQHAKGMVHLGLKVFLVADKAVFEVQDDGCGIPEEKLKSVFYGSHEAYEVSSDCKRSNAGIGLAVCATIIKAHGGKIKAENKKNGGALFRFYLDMEEKEQA